MNEIQLLAEKVRAKIKKDPEFPLEPPTLSALLERIDWATRKPNMWSSKYLDLLERDIANARLCLDKAEELVKELRKIKK